jgi:uncharacterized protein
MNRDAIYTDVPRDEVERLLREAPYGLLVTRGPGGEVQTGLLNHALDGAGIFLHMRRDDPQVASLRADPRCTFVVHDYLATIPSHFVDAAYAGAATAYYRWADLDARATIVDDPAAMVAPLRALLERLQPDGGYAPLTADDPRYRGSLEALALVRLEPVAVRAKWKLGQNRPAATRRRVVEQLRARGEHRCADEVERDLARSGLTSLT